VRVAKRPMEKTENFMIACLRVRSLLGVVKMEASVEKARFRDQGQVAVAKPALVEETELAVGMRKQTPVQNEKVLGGPRGT